jgi:hypothetical protein
MRKLTQLLAASIALFGATVTHAATLTAYSWDFDGASTAAPGVLSVISNLEGLTTPSQGFNGVGGFAGNFSRSTNTTGIQLDLTGLPAHTSLDVNFLLAMIDSWDSTNGSPAPDYFNVEIDGTNVLQVTCNNASGSVCYSGLVVAPMAPRGFNGSWPDIGFDMAPVGALSVAHTASTATIKFFASGNGWQGGDDESWAIDNLSVVLETTGVPPSIPEPASLALVGAGLLGLVGMRRRRT